MRIAMLSPIAWRTPPRHYGPWESVVSLLTEGLLAKGVEVTLFATADSRTAGALRAVCRAGYEEDEHADPKVLECLHISEIFEHAEQFDLIHNHFDFLPLTYSGLVSTPVVTTIHGFSSPRILPVYKKYNKQAHYVAISEADRSPELDYIATIHHGIDFDEFNFNATSSNYLLFFGRIHPDKGAKEAIEVAMGTDRNLIMAGPIQDEIYYEREVEPHLDTNGISYVGSVGPEKRDELLRNAHVLLHLINFNEPFGLSVVEAMACGTPVIAFDRGSMPELIRNGLNGYLVRTVDDAIDAVRKIDDIDRLACRRFVEENFSIERMVNDYLQVYEQILKLSKRESHRPWGFYEILSDTVDHKVKRIVVHPGKRLSLQRHRHRDEHWYVVAGEALMTLDEKQLRLNEGDSIDIPRGAVHRIENTTEDDMTFIEVQSGDYFGEDDIERLEDDFGRVEEKS
ncbi:MAG: glycosyltransferase [Candidatus Marinimicrobia bacterium]|nr:glycosyltransferase [Candidatus Neomarinimicrobiota bacterium]